MNCPVGTVETMIGATVGELDTPALLVDAVALEANIAAMAKLCAGKAARLRPHAKTHKSPIIAVMQLDAGAAGICCAKLSEAEAIANDGRITDIMVTTPLVGRSKLKQLARLSRVAKVAVLADDETAIAALAELAAAEDRKIDVLIEVDVGQNRCGIPPGPAAARLAEAVGRSNRLQFKGLHGYHGKLQMMQTYTERFAAVRRALELLQESAELCPQGRSQGGDPDRRWLGQRRNRPRARRPQRAPARQLCVHGLKLSENPVGRNRCAATVPACAEHPRQRGQPPGRGSRCGRRRLEIRQQRFLVRRFRRETG